MLLIKVCHPACTQCNGGLISNCLSCGVYNSIQYLLYGSTCYTNCPSLSYKNSTTTCDACDISCIICVGSSNQNCSTCAINRYFLSINNSCPSNCPDGYYANSTTSTC